MVCTQSVWFLSEMTKVYIWRHLSKTVHLLRGHYKYGKLQQPFYFVETRSDVIRLHDISGGLVLQFISELFIRILSDNMKHLVIVPRKST